MNTAIIDIKWLISFGLKVARVVFWPTGLIVTLTLISQLSALLASFLPLKVIILLGSEGIPRYLPDTLAAYGKDVLIIMFSVITLVFFIVHLITEKLIELSTQSATKQLLRRSSKLVLFENQGEIASNAYLRFSGALSGMIFFVLGALVLFWVYPEMAVVVSIYVVTISVMFSLLWKKNEKFRYKFDQKYRALLKISSSIGFFTVFGFMILDFVYLPAPGIIAAIVSILLSRIMLQKFTGSFADMIYLTKNRFKLEPLFFHGSALMEQKEPRSGRNVWSVLDGDVISKLEPVMSDLKPDWSACESVRWYQTGISDVVGLQVKDESGQIFLVKVFGQKREGMALHEATLVGESIRYFPAPDFVGTTTMLGFQCIVYQVSPFQYGDTEDIRHVPELVRGLLMGVEPPEALVRSYVRSRPLLADRLKMSMTEDLKRCATNEEERKNLDMFSNIFGALKNFVNAMPLVFTSGDLNPSSVVFDLESQEAVVLNWGRWGLDPIGSGWRTRVARMEKLLPSLREAQEKRPTLEPIQVAEVELVAFLSALESAWSRQLFGDALALLPDILQCVYRVERWHEFYSPAE